MIAPQIGLENESYGFGGEPSRVSQMDSLQGSRIDAKVKSSPDPSEKNVGTGSSQNEARHVLLNGIPIVSLIIDGQERLCLAQISNTLLKEFSYNEIHNRRVALGITCVQCTPVQLEILRRAGAMPISSRRCGMITKREAERLCKSFLCDNEPPKLPEDFAFDVYHECAWGSRGCFIPSRYNSSRAKCIRCSFCNLFFSPNKFIFHSHRLPVSKYVQPDAANFNSWRRHIKLSDITNEDVNFAWEDVKAMFNGGSRKRTMSSSSSSVSRVGMVAKRPRCDNPSNTSVPVSSAPPAPLQHPLPSHRLVEKTPPYMPIIPFTGKTYPIGGFQPTSTSDLVWNKNSIHPNGTYPHNLSSIIWSANHGSILSSALVQKPTSSWSPYQPHEVPLVDLRSAVGGMYGKMRMGPEFLPSVSYSDVRSAFKPVQRLGGSHKDLEFPSSIRERNEEGGIDIKIDETSSLNRHEYKSDSDIDVNDLSDDNRTPTPLSNAVESIIKSSSVSSIRQPLSPVTTRTEPPEKVDAFESNSNKDGLNQDELTRLCLVNEQNNDIQMHMKLVREKFFYKLEEERATRLAVQQKLKEAHEALHKVSCNSPSCNCKN